MSDYLASFGYEPEKKESPSVNPAEIDTKEDELNEVEYTIEYQKTGNAVIPVIDGVEHPELIMGYTSDADMKAGLGALKLALKGANGNISKAMSLMYAALMNSAKDIHPDEQVEIEGYQFMIVYKTKKIYTLLRVEVANLDDLGDCELPDVAVKALLVERAKTWIADEKAAAEAGYDDEDCDDDYYDEDGDNYITRIGWYD